MKPSNLALAFKKCRQENRPALLTYTVSGDPNKKKSFEILKVISRYADICEIGVEAGGPKNSKKHAAPLTYKSKIGVLHGALQYVISDAEGQIQETESISAGLDYPGVSPLHCFLKDTKRARYTAATDEEALEAFKLVSKLEKVRPSLEPAHAFAEAIKIAPRLSKDTIIVVNSCGDAKKDMKIIKARLGHNL